MDGTTTGLQRGERWGGAGPNGLVQSVRLGGKDGIWQSLEGRVGFGCVEQSGKNIQVEAVSMRHRHRGRKGHRPKETYEVFPVLPCDTLLVPKASPTRPGLGIYGGEGYCGPKGVGLQMSMINHIL